MSDDFDYYYKWLGIPPADQPPNHYRLLGLPNFTDDPEVIANAADGRSSLLRTFQLGPRSALSQQVLNEVTRARISLLDPDKKAAYDAELRRSLAERDVQPAATVTDLAATPGPTINVSEPLQPIVSVKGETAASNPSKASKPHAQKRQKKKTHPLVEFAKIVAGGIAGLVIAYFLVGWIAPDNEFFGPRKSTPQKQVARSDNTISLPPSIQPPPANSSSHTTTDQENAATPANSIKPTTVAVVPPSEPSSTEATKSVAPPPVAEPIQPAAPLESDEERMQRLRTERDTALAAGNLGSALRAAEELASLTGSGILERRLAFLSPLRDAAATPDEFQRVTEHLLRLLHLAVDENRKDLAQRHIDHLIAGARRSGDDDLIRWATMCVVKIQEM